MAKQLLVSLFTATIILTALSFSSYGQTNPKIKLHKARVSVSSPDAQGQVNIVGQTGAVETTGPAVTEITILKPAGAFDVAADGSFTAQVRADGGDKIRIQASNNSKKKSYGTFTVPGQSETPAKNTQTILNTTPLSANASSVSLAMYINIIDTQTGDLIAKERLDFTLQTDPANPAALTQQIEKLLANCRNSIKKQTTPNETVTQTLTPALTQDPNN